VKAIISSGPYETKVYPDTAYDDVVYKCDITVGEDEKCVTTTDISPEAAQARAQEVCYALNTFIPLSVYTGILISGATTWVNTTSEHAFTHNITTAALMSALSIRAEIMLGTEWIKDNCILDEVQHAMGSAAVEVLELNSSRCSAAMGREAYELGIELAAEAFVVFEDNLAPGQI